MEKDYVKINKISQALTGDNFKIRRTTAKFKAVIDECNETVHQIITRAPLTEAQEKTRKKINL